MKRWFKNNALMVTGVCIGCIAGFLYWKYVGCASGTCVITSKPINSSVYGAVMGGLLFSIFQPNQKKADNDI
jgi:hypothetical protein